MLPKRNLRSTTLQASMAMRAKSFASSEGAMSQVYETTDKKRHSVVDKENVAPVASGYSQPSLNQSRIKSVSQDWDDLDAEDAGDLTMVSEYAPEIFSYMMKLEVYLNARPIVHFNICCFGCRRRFCLLPE